GETAGRMYAISTVGSLVGTFTASLLLIPLIGTQRTFLTYAISLALVAALGLGRRWLPAPVAVALLLLVPVGTVKAAEEGTVVHEAETPYQYARVVQYPDGRRQLELNEGQAVHSVWRPDTVLTGNYWDGYLTLPFTLRDDPPAKVAMLGVDVHVVQEEYPAALVAAGMLPRDADLPLASRARHLADVALAQLRTGRHEQALRTVLTMERMAPDWIPYQTLPRQVTAELVERHRRVPAELRELALRIGAMNG
ncbi:MAG TPA: fused MFS/spermidine synthase, partial [Pseudonocardiaceae bacterium]|nr:fused MFS/spermidine synthase [Pseudonocardiaceae bacterium]